jgi:hypothetical protein
MELISKLSVVEAVGQSLVTIMAGSSLDHAIFFPAMSNPGGAPLVNVVVKLMKELEIGGSKIASSTRELK